MKKWCYGVMARIRRKASNWPSWSGEITLDRDFKAGDIITVSLWDRIKDGRLRYFTVGIAKLETKQEREERQGRSGTFKTLKGAFNGIGHERPLRNGGSNAEPMGSDACGAKRGSD